MKNRSPPTTTIPRFSARIYRGSLDRCLYFLSQLEKVRGVEGDIVECGVSIGHGALLFLLLSQYLGVERTYYGFDSFERLPGSRGTGRNYPDHREGFPGAIPRDRAAGPARRAGP